MHAQGSLGHGESRVAAHGIVCHDVSRVWLIFRCMSICTIMNGAYRESAHGIVGHYVALWLMWVSPQHLVAEVCVHLVVVTRGDG